MEKGKDSLWIHAASVGEFNTLKPLLKRLYPYYHIVLTYFSFRARSYLENQRGYFHELHRLPFDLPPFVKGFEDRIKPKAILIMERELWPSLLLFTKAPKIWLNAYSKGGFWERWLAKSFSLIITKEEAFAERFRSYGCKRVVACGNLKFALEEPKRVSLNCKKSKLLIAGSTHQGEELLIKKVYERLKEELPHLKLVLAPRHIKRCSEVVEIFKGYKVSLRSKEEKNWEVLVVDTLGELFSLYEYGDIAFVGGTFVKAGGHNLLEPAYFGKPVVFGPYTQKVEDLKDFLEKKGLGFQVRDEEDLYRVLYKLLTEEKKEKGFNLKDYGDKVLNCYFYYLGELLPL
ncbi:MAG: 3-deoxy-D-manno-octulosonic acid transferase [Aquificaceae bacterium]